MESLQFSYNKTKAMREIYFDVNSIIRISVVHNEAHAGFHSNSSTWCKSVSQVEWRTQEMWFMCNCMEYYACSLAQVPIFLLIHMSDFFLLDPSPSTMRYSVAAPNGPSSSSSFVAAWCASLHSQPHSSSIQYCSSSSSVSEPIWSWGSHKDHCCFTRRPSSDGGAR